MAGSLKTVVEQLEKGTPVDSRDPAGQTALFWAVMQNDVPMVEVLLKHGADIEKQNDTGQTPLMGAALKGHVQIIKILLELGADINRMDGTGLTSWAWAALSNREEACMYLLEAGADSMLHHRHNTDDLPLVGLEELADWNGTGAEAKLCIGCLGLVFDVSSGASFYGPGGGYAAFAGNDATIALGKHIVDIDHPGTKYTELTIQERIGAENWSAKFKQKYKLIGKLHSLHDDLPNSKL
eukprot:CAMPEP_0204840982 /NCGR_PEP_ID=MMETSP1346-20131115/39942_1 /ASSEMBLY_ACC=CAM_ASM_000771 /TAXON_ID=215587 /ORGANISM="Aplanochytrium stocchinoi, Strain GSBS06" /LENGTH=238 /DNA_ID=CAMNT_0051978765 /DNA_START=57 /DNA_END=773 /DNA_ORIENTATION=-